MLEKLKKYINSKPLNELQKEWNSLSSHDYDYGIYADDLIEDFKKRHTHNSNI